VLLSNQARNDSTGEGDLVSSRQVYIPSFHISRSCLVNPRFLKPLRSTTNWARIKFISVRSTAATTAK
jgi:hypothetical protein